MLSLKITRKLQTGLLLFFLFLLFGSICGVFYIKFFVNTTSSSAQNCTDITNPRFENGLLTTPLIPNPGNNKFGGTINGGPGPCIINPNAAQLANFQIPSYAELKRDFFEKVTINYLNQHLIDKVTNPPGLGASCGAPTQANLVFTNHDKLFNFINPAGAPCDFILGGNPTGTKNGVVFIDGDLLITADSMYPNAHAQNVAPAQTAGVIYIVKGSVYIDRSVGIIDGVIMAGGTISTSCSGKFCVTDSAANTKQLVVYGNFVNLDATKPIQFERDLSLVNGNSAPAEQIVADPKYLTLFRQIFSQVFSVQTEDTNFATRP